ncbi:MAG: biotin synthase BioB [Gammaproteobacteria bacterium]|nr:biotin synthase BioB [Gammaproteobacteria bacterium]
MMDKIEKQDGLLRHDWTVDEIAALYDMPFNDLLFEAQTVHRKNFNPNEVQVSTLLSIKTGKCPEDCGYCPQSVRYDTEVENEPLMPLDEVIESAKLAKSNGSSRFCMGAAWRSPKDKDLEPVIKMVKEVKALGMETCLTLGMLTESQANQLKEAGLDYYNHNLDTSPEFYGEVITTRTYQDRLDTLQHVRDAGMNTCCGGILGMGESRRDRIGLFLELANQEHHPESVPINLLVRVSGTPLEDGDDLDSLEFIRSVAVARIMMPKSFVRLSAGRENMSDEMQAMCFFAGANSVFYGEKLLTTPNPDTNHDTQLFNSLGITAI